jgi:hypothetical protein
VFFFNDFLSSKFHITKEFLGGMFITIGMTGLRPGPDAEKP